MLPSLATTIELEDLTYPIIMQPKIDGVRGWNPDGRLLGRSMEEHANKYVTQRYSAALFAGCDGELHFGNPCANSVCRATTSAINTIGGKPDVHWTLFDLVTRETFWKPYEQRLIDLQCFVQRLEKELPSMAQGIAVIPSSVVHSLDEVLELERHYTDAGYEAVCFRRPDAVFRSGRLPPQISGVLRYKRFEDREGIITGLIEGQINNNIQVYGADGYAKRSTHAENMVPSGTIASLVVRDLHTGKTHTVAKGKLTAAECANYFKNPELILGRTCTYRSFPRGVMNQLRWPTFRNFRAASDLEK